MSVVIEMKDVCFSALNQDIVKNFSHQYEEGKTTALIGPSGSGKTTLIKLTAGILVPTAGEVKYRGKDVFTLNRQENLDFRRECSMVFQDSAIWANKSLYETLELPLQTHFPAMSALDRKKRIAEVLQVVGYAKDTAIRPDRLSMGELKLIAFARAIVCGPKLLFLDEWTESVDESATQRLIRLVQGYQKEYKTIILVSHDYRIIKNLADYVIMIVPGKNIIKVTKEEIKADEKIAKYIEEGIA